MKTLSKIILMATILLGGICRSIAQESSESSIRLGGPRIGMSYVHFGGWLGGITLSEVGWQFEGALSKGASGGQVLLQGLVLLEGLEYGDPLSTWTVLVSSRNAKGLEVGVGPHIYLVGMPLVGGMITIGIANSGRKVSVPVSLNIASVSGVTKVGLLIGLSRNRKG